MPGRLEEFLRRCHEFLSTGANALGIAHHDKAALGQRIGQQMQFVRQDRSKCLHAVHCDALGEAIEDVAQRRVLSGQLACAVAHVRGEHEFPRGVDLDTLDMAQRPLVTHREVTNLLDDIAPELDAHRMFGRGGKDVDDAAANRELAAFLDQVGAQIAPLDQSDREFLEVYVIALRQRDHRHVAQPMHDRLQRSSDRGRDDPKVIGGTPVRDTAKHRKATAHRLRRGTQPLMREGFPGRQVHRCTRSEDRLHGGGQVLGLAGRGGKHTGELARWQSGADLRQEKWPALSDRRDMASTHAAKRSIVDRAGPGDASGEFCQTLQRHALPACCIASRSCSVMTGRPTSRLVTYGVG